MNPSPRILLYSHDTFGLGHIRRNRKIAHSLAAAFPHSKIVIATGSARAGSFPEQPGVTIEVLPAVRKKADGAYESATFDVPLSATIARRRARLTEIAHFFDPDILITDKEARGLLGELEPALDLVKSRGGQAVLGLREVLDAPDVLAREWQQNRTFSAIERWYDEIWIYGTADFHDPFEGLEVPAGVEEKKQFMGFLSSGTEVARSPALNGLSEDFVLVTTGGGGDGEELLEAVIACGESRGGFAMPVVILPGPFLSGPVLEKFARRTEPLKNARLLGFDPETEAVMCAARAVIAMCGYNTFCEILEFDKPTLFVPREAPRSEQLIRARVASARGLANYMRIGEAAKPQELCNAMKKLLGAAPPSASGNVPDFSGMETLVRRVRALLPEYGWKREAVS